MTTDFDSLQQKWRAQDARLDDMLALNRRVLRALDRGRSRSALRRFRGALWAQVGVDAVAALAVGTFTAAHAHDARYLVPGVALLMFVIAVMITAIRQLVMLTAIDDHHDAPVAVMQQQLEHLRAFRIRVTVAVILSAMVIWVPLAIVMLKGLADVDVYAVFPPWVFGVNLAAGAALIPIALALSARYAGALGAHPVAQRLARDLAGTSLNEAQTQLAKLKEFEEG